MFDIGWSEILVIVIITILVVGPKELPGLLRTVGKTIGNVRRMAGDFQNQFNDALREAELDEVKNAIGDVRSLNPKTAVKDAVQKQLGFDNDMADELTEQVSQSGREINEALSETAVVQSETKADPEPVTKTETKPAAKAKTKAVAKTEAKSDVPAEAKPAAKPKARTSAKTKAQPAARTRAKKADASPATSANTETAAPARKPRRAKPATPAKAKPAAPNEAKNASPSGDDPSQKA